MGSPRKEDSSISRSDKERCSNLTRKIIPLLRGLFSGGGIKCTITLHVSIGHVIWHPTVPICPQRLKIFEYPLPWSTALHHTDAVIVLPTLADPLAWYGETVSKVGYMVGSVMIISSTLKGIEASPGYLTALRRLCSHWGQNQSNFSREKTDGLYIDLASIYVHNCDEYWPLSHRTNDSL